MFKISKKYALSVGHILTADPKSKCFRPHGHNLIVEIVIEARGLDYKNMVIDFHDLDSIMNEVLDKYDHRFLLKESVEVPFLEEDIVRVQGDPTSEKIALDIFYLLKDLIRDALYIKKTPGNLKEVKVYENETSYASYIEDK